MNPPAIRIEKLSKQYRIGGPQKKYNRFGDQVVDMVLSPLHRIRNVLEGRSATAYGQEQQIWAVKDISFVVQPGEVVGIIGRNGAGKSTLLKILSKITEPTSGYAEIYGRVGSLLEVGTGFHPELTGRENIFLNGAILGMHKSEVQRKLDEIIAFAEIDKFLDTPVKQYSSGMYVRLAFSVAAHLETEILIVDEVLAVGDIAFQRKCLGKMDDVAHQGRTVLFVSHNMGVIQALCQRGILVADGCVFADGPIMNTIDTYQRMLEQSAEHAVKNRTDRQGHGLIQLEKVVILNGNGEDDATLVTGRPALFEFYLNRVMARTSCVFTVINQLGQRVVSFKSDALAPQDRYTSGNETKFVCEVEQLLLTAGHYYLNVLIRGGGERQDFVEAAATFDVLEGQLDGRPIKPYREISVCMPHRWTIPDRT